MTDDKITDLIAEARGRAAVVRDWPEQEGVEDGEMFDRLADALEATKAEIAWGREINRRAELQYQELEVYWDAERQRADSVQAALDGFRGVARGDNEYLIGRAEKAEAERDTLRAVISEFRSYALDLLDADDDSYDGSMSAAWVAEVASLAIDTKEKS